jgi:hypothetical protein
MLGTLEMKESKKKKEHLEIYIQHTKWMKPKNILLAADLMRLTSVD